MYHSIVASLKHAGYFLKLAAELTLEEAETLFQDLLKIADKKENFSGSGLDMSDRGKKELKRLMGGKLQADNFADAIKRAMALISLAAQAVPAFSYLKGYFDKRVMPHLNFLAPHQRMKPFNQVSKEVKDLLKRVLEALEGRGPAVGPRPPEMSTEPLKKQLEKTKDIGEGGISYERLQEIEKSRPTRMMPLAR